MVAASSPISLYRTQANQPVYTAVFTTTWPRPEPARAPVHAQQADLVQQAPARPTLPSKALLASLSSITLLDTTPLHQRINRSQILATYQQQDLSSSILGRALGGSADSNNRSGSHDDGKETPLQTWDITMVPEGMGTMVDTYA
jgi:hypothetical protein